MITHSLLAGFLLLGQPCLDWAFTEGNLLFLVLVKVLLHPLLFWFLRFLLFLLLLRWLEQQLFPDAYMHLLGHMSLVFRVWFRWLELLLFLSLSTHVADGFGDHVRNCLVLKLLSEPCSAQLPWNWMIRKGLYLPSFSFTSSLMETLSDRKVLDHNSLYSVDAIKF